MKALCLSGAVKYSEELDCRDYRYSEELSEVKLYYD
jgi:hypothetical protein